MLIYTSIYGDYDNLRQPQITSVGDYSWVCIGDRNGKHGVWDLRKVNCNKSGRLCSRSAKIQFYGLLNNGDISIWHGGNVMLRGDINQLLETVSNNDISIIKHNQRNCIYEEAKVCMDWKLDNPLTIKSQMERYKRDGYPAGNGLSAAFLIVRRNTKQIRGLMDLWWSEIIKGSIRDQLSFDYCCWKLGIKPNIIPGDIFEGENYKRYPVHEK